VATAAQPAYNEIVRGLQGQATDLESIRSHVNLALSAGGVAAAFLAANRHSSGPFFWVAVASFAVMALVSVRIYWPVAFWYDFVDQQLSTAYIGSGKDADSMFSDLSILGEQRYTANRVALTWRWHLQNIAFIAFGLEVAGLLLHLAADWG
jgi:hypothetical protein